MIEKVNGQNKSGLVLIEKNFTQMLSGISRDLSGRIVGAKGRDDLLLENDFAHSAL